jgi:hydroxyethylthiazole kinase-like sugar kinase family protein
MRPESRVRPSRSGNQHVLPRVIGAVAGIALAAWSAYWLFAGQDHGKLLTILVGTACIAGCWLAAVASLGSKRGTAVASAAAVIIGAVSAIVARHSTVRYRSHRHGQPDHGQPAARHHPAAPDQAGGHPA